jgi:hypothetical protein
LRLILIRVLALLLPLFLIAWAVYICELELYRLFGAYLIELPPYQPLLPLPGRVAED